MKSGFTRKANTQFQKKGANPYPKKFSPITKPVKLGKCLEEDQIAEFIQGPAPRPKSPPNISIKKPGVSTKSGKNKLADSIRHPNSAKSRLDKMVFKLAPNPR